MLIKLEFSDFLPRHFAQMVWKITQRKESERAQNAYFECLSDYWVMKGNAKNASCPLRSTYYFPIERNEVLGKFMKHISNS